MRAACAVRPSHLALHTCFFTDTATTEIYTLSLHDALPISTRGHSAGKRHRPQDRTRRRHHFLRGDVPTPGGSAFGGRDREEHTSELQSPDHLVCRLLLEKKKQNAHPG